MHDGYADPPSEAPAVQFEIKKMKASVKWNLLYPSLWQFQDINDLYVVSTGIQYNKTCYERIGYEIVTNLCMYADTHTLKQGGDLGFIYLTNDNSRCYSAKLLRYQY